MWWMFRNMEDVRVRRDEMSPSLRHVKRLCVVGLPMGFEYSVSAIGAVILQNAINSLGAQRYLFLCSCLFVFHGSLMIFRNTLQGMGYSFHAIISGVWELVGRSLGGWLAVHAAGFTAVCLANPMAWIFALGYCIVLVFYMIRKNEKRLGIYQ